METISVYLDNMFASLPRTAELQRLKQELLSGMEEKYRELKLAGKSENEAIGIVISEFGNIEELTAELDMASNEPELSQQPVLTEEEVYAYTEAKRIAGLSTGIGIVLCASGLALLLVLDALFGGNSLMTESGSFELGTVLGMFCMSALVAAAVAMFIASGMRLSRFKHLEQGFQLPYALKLELQQRQSHYAPTYRFALISGVCLCVLSPALIFTAAAIDDDFAAYGIAGFLVLVSVAVFLFVHYGNIQGAYTKLLEEPAIAAGKREEERIMGVIGAIVWPLATGLFLLTGFVYGRWDINWIIFPFVGILHGLFSNIHQALNRKKVS